MLLTDEEWRWIHEGRAGPPAAASWRFYLPRRVGNKASPRQIVNGALDGSSLAAADLLLRIRMRMEADDPRRGGGFAVGCNGLLPPLPEMREPRAFARRDGPGSPGRAREARPALRAGSLSVPCQGTSARRQRAVTEVFVLAGSGLTIVGTDIVDTYRKCE